MSGDFSFINRSFLISTFVTFLVVITSFVYYNKNFALGALAGGVWNIINVYFLARLVKAAFNDKSPNRKKIAYLVFIKFPLLYGAGFLVLRYGGVSLYGALVGFSILFIVMALKALGATVIHHG